MDAQFLLFTLIVSWYPYYLMDSSIDNFIHVYCTQSNMFTIA